MVNRTYIIMVLAVLLGLSGCSGYKQRAGKYNYSKDSTFSGNVEVVERKLDMTYRSTDSTATLKVEASEQVIERLLTKLREEFAESENSNVNRRWFYESGGVMYEEERISSKTVTNVVSADIQASKVIETLMDRFDSLVWESRERIYVDSMLHRNEALSTETSVSDTSKVKREFNLFQVIGFVLAVVLFVLLIYDVIRFILKMRL